MHDGDALGCPCGNKLAVWRAEFLAWDIRHRGRSALARDVLLLGCENCGEAVPVPPMTAPATAVLVRAGQPVPWVDRADSSPRVLHSS